MSGLPPWSTLGLELVFLPRRPRSKWQEWRDKGEAQMVCDMFNSDLCSSSIISAYAAMEGVKPLDLFWGKADIFRSVALSADPQPHDSWCLEINNAPIPIRKVINEEPLIIAVLEAIYDIAAALDLHPHIQQTKKDGTVREWPTGGGHQHVSMDFWDEGAQYFPKMYHLERGLCLDFCNHPFIRWLFSQWSDNLNSAIPVTLPTAKLVTGQLRSRATTRLSATEWVHDQALLCHSIKQRTARTGKPLVASYEFRFFDMPRNVKELVLQTQFLAHWVGYWRKRVDEMGDYANTVGIHKVRARWDEDVKYTLTPGYLKRLKRDLPFARKEMEEFFWRIGLDPQPYFSTWFDRNYRKRMAFGKAV